MPEFGAGQTSLDEETIGRDGRGALQVLTTGIADGNTVLAGANGLEVSKERNILIGEFKNDQGAWTGDVAVGTNSNIEPNSYSVQYYKDAVFERTVKIPERAETLTFHTAGAQDGNGAVMVNGSDLATFSYIDATDSKHTVDISNYQGQEITLRFDNRINTSLYLGRIVIHTSGVIQADGITETDGEGGTDVTV
jgi:hypothetical protein